MAGTDRTIPVAVSVYDRLDHVKECIGALTKCIGAGDTELFIFSDGPKAGDEQKIESVRRYLSTIVGFKKVNLEFRDKNYYIQNNRMGQKHLLDRYGWVIWLEDDIVAAPGFLEFMKTALIRFEGNKNIFSVCGYKPPFRLPEDYEKEYMVMPRFSAWGCGIWKDRYEKLKYLTWEDFQYVVDNRTDFIEKIGEDALPMLFKEQSGEIDALDIKAIFHSWKNDCYTVYPSRSLTRNIGHDGSGIHCGNTDRFDVALSTKTRFELAGAPDVDDRILRRNSRFRKMKILSRIKYRLRVRRTMIRRACGVS